MLSTELIIPNYLIQRINELYFTCTHSNSFLIVFIPGYLTLIHSKVHHLASAAFSHVKTIHEFMNAFISSHETTIHSFTQSLTHYIHLFTRSFIIASFIHSFANCLSLVLNGQIQNSLWGVHTLIALGHYQTIHDIYSLCSITSRFCLLV